MSTASLIRCVSALTQLAMGSLASQRCTSRMDDNCKWDELPGCPALPQLLEAAVLPVLEATAGRSAPPELLEAAEEKKLRSALAGRSALLQLVLGSALTELLGPAAAGRFMACSTKIVVSHYKASKMAAGH